MKALNTNAKMKKDNWPKFAELIENQFKHGGQKYMMDGRDDKEVSDWACEMSPGKTGSDWILATMAKYIGRYRNFGREKDLLKIATYAFIAWLKSGHHLEDVHDEDVSREKDDE